MILPLLKTIFAEIRLKHPDTGDEGNGKVIIIFLLLFVYLFSHSKNLTQHEQKVLIKL